MKEDYFIVFIDPRRYTDFHISDYVKNIEAEFGFISAYGIKADFNTVMQLQNLESVNAISIRTNVFCGVETEGFESLGFNYHIDYDASETTVAIIDSGIYMHLDFVMPNMRIKFFKDFVNFKSNPYDDNGHGTAVAGVIAGNGIANGKKISGFAPNCDLIILKAIKSTGEGSAFNILSAMQWIYDNHLNYNIQAVCMSFGAEPLKKNDPLVIGAETLWDEGITVVASAGNNGPGTETIRSPGCSAKIITVGGAEIEDGFLRVPDYSSRGPAGDISKPDIVAPATNIKCCGNKGNYVTLSGTSFAAPLVAGICAVIKSRHPEYTPDKVKEILLDNAVDFCKDENACGKGLIDTDFLLNDF